MEPEGYEVLYIWQSRKFSIWTRRTGEAIKLCTIILFCLILSSVVSPVVQFKQCWLFCHQHSWERSIHARLWENLRKHVCSWGIKERSPFGWLHTRSNCYHIFEYPRFSLSFKWKLPSTLTMHRGICWGKNYVQVSWKQTTYNLTIIH